jgi:hypothetical protein
MAEPFNRPELTREEEIKVWRIANFLFSGKVNNKRELLSGIIMENIKLIREVNIHRKNLGYELLPEYNIPT